MMSTSIGRSCGTMGFSDGQYEIFKGDYLRAVGSLEKEIAEFIASLQNVGAAETPKGEHHD